jgi:Uma2 family endonuclease
MSSTKNFLTKPSVEQTDPPRPPKETLPTMYDLPDEDLEEPGLPDEFHYLQPNLLSVTFRLTDYVADRIFTSGDLNVYYDVQHPLWHKRPDWFAVIGVSRLYENQDLRRSYVLWQEGVSPAIVVELLSPGTEDEDLGRTERDEDSPPTKWQVYEQILRVPYYVVYDRFSNQLRAFHLVGGQYQELNLPELRVWMPTLNIGLGVWQGTYQGIERGWLRWFDELNNWLPTDAEIAEQAQQQAEQERQRTEQAQQQAEQAQQQAEQERQRAERLAERLRSLGIDPDE